MFRNQFGEPKPANAEELREAIDDLGLKPGSCAAIIAEPDPDDKPPFVGWTAEISGDDEEGDTVVLNTAGFESREALIEALSEHGITDYD